MAIDGLNGTKKVYPPGEDGAPGRRSGNSYQAMPPTGKAFAATQSHWFRLADGKIIEHWANRDDLAMAQQLGWIPPSPRYLARMALAKHRARTAAR